MTETEIEILKLCETGLEINSIDRSKHEIINNLYKNGYCDSHNGSITSTTYVLTYQGKDVLRKLEQQQEKERIEKVKQYQKERSEKIYKWLSIIIPSVISIIALLIQIIK